MQSTAHIIVHMRIDIHIYIIYTPILYTYIHIYNNIIYNSHWQSSCQTGSVIQRARTIKTHFRKSNSTEAGLNPPWLL